MGCDGGACEAAAGFWFASGPGGAEGLMLLLLLLLVVLPPPTAAPRMTTLEALVAEELLDPIIMAGFPLLPRKLELPPPTRGGIEGILP